MTLTEVLPEVQSLSKPDKLRLFRLLAQELEQVEDLIPLGQSYPVRSPDRAFEAAQALLDALEADRRRS